MPKLKLLLIALLIACGTQAQVVEVTSTTTPEVEVCVGTGETSVTVYNLYGAALTNLQVKVSLPEGADYVPGSLTEVTAYSMQEQQVTEDSALLFSANNLPHNDSIVFSFRFTAGMAAIAEQDAGVVFRNRVTVNSNETQEIEDGPSYNILYPVFTILGVSPTSQTIVSGATTQRTIQIINGGNGKTDLIKVTDFRNNPVLSLTGVDIGTLTGDTIVLTSTEFASIGNGDGYFDQYETITITETLSGTSCSDVTVTSSIRTHWGCGDQISTSTSYAHVTLDFQNPSLVQSATETFNSCFGAGNASVQELLIRNTGSGMASGITADLFKSLGSNYDESIFSRFDEASLQMKQGANATYVSWTDLTSFSTSNAGDYACLGSNPIGRMLVNLPDMAPGDSIYLRWDMYSCCLQTCSNDKVRGWRAELDYTDVCAVQTYSKNSTQQGTNNQSIEFFTESPIEVYPSQLADFVFTVSGFSNNLPQGDGAHYEVVIDLDNGLNYNGLAFNSNGNTWTPFSTDHDVANNIITASFATPVPFTLTRSELVLTVSGTSGPSGNQQIDLDLAYVPDTSCTACSIALMCTQSTDTYLDAASGGAGSCTSLGMLEFSVERISFGLPDNNFDGIADGSGSLDMTKVKTLRAMVGDTLQAISRAVVGTTSSTWAHAGFTSTIEYGSVLTPIAATVQLYDASAATAYTIAGLTATTAVNGNELEVTYDLSASVLAALEPALSGYAFASGDSVTFTVDYRVAASVDDRWQQATFYNNMYLSSVANPTDAQKDYCTERDGRLTLIGYTWRNNSSNNFTVNSCTRVTNQNFGMAIGPGSSNYAGGNLFPFEYRHWGILKEAWVIVPAHYSHVNSTLRQTRTRATNSTQNQSDNSVSPDAINGDTLYYNVAQYYSNGTFNRSDDGFNGRIQVELAPSCDVPQNTYQDLVWLFNYEKSTAIDGAESGTVAASGPDKIRYSPSSLELSSDNPRIDANTRQVSWNYKVKNNSSSGADHAWLHLVVPQNIQITSVTDNGGTPLTQQGDLYLIGSINANSTANLTINGDVTNCDTVALDAFSGFECTGYPADFASFTCNIEHLGLYVEPKPAAYQPRITTQLMPDPCSPLVEVTVDITSVKLAHMFDMTIDLITPDTQKIKVMNDSSTFQYNMSNPFATISDPAFNANTYSYIIDDYDPSFATNGIPGVLDLDNNQYKLKTTLALGAAFEQGDFLQIQIQGANACTEPLPTINLAYDPSSKFEKDQTAGLHIDIGDSWSASWGDYDSDGYDDLFVPVKTLNQPNLLYHNNGDGTFTKVTTGPVATDLGASISGTWGDYDNDGHLDLFVANNENSPNRLYHNNGDGTFSRVTNTPVVDKGVYSHSAAWADYNKDGNLDLAVSDFHPTHFNFLFLGDGQGGFTEDAASPFALSATSAVGIAWGDYDNDGDLDLFVANTNGENNQLFRNDNGLFTALDSGAVVTDGGHSVGGTWGDYDNDGDLDLYVTNSQVFEANFFYENDGDGTFTKITNNEVVNHPSNSHGASWIDFDNDGDLDLLVANNQNTQNHLFSNHGDGTFSSIANAITADLNDSYGTAWSDYDNDGDYDLFVANIGTNANDFFVNQKGSCTNHIVVKLSGCNSNSFGIGAMVKVKATIGGTPTWQTKHVSTQTSALAGQNSPKLLFGLLDATAVDSVIVIWPSGIVSTLTNVTLNSLLTVDEPCGAKVCGVVYYDANGNQVRDNGEPGIPNIPIRVTPGNFQVYTNDSGEYQFYAEDGVYTIEQETGNNWVQSYPLLNGDHSVTVNQASQTEYCGRDFGNTPVCSDPELNVQVGTSAFRRGLTNQLLVAVVNESAFDAQAGITLEVALSDNVYLVDGGHQSVVENGGIRTYTYALDSILALRDTVLHLTDSVDNAAAIDAPVTVDVTVTYLATECDTTDNTASFADVVVGSIDPNDKQVFVGSRGVQTKAAQSDLLTYRVRFQNIGNYAARIVTIRDTLSPYLDWDSFEFLGASHTFDYQVVNGVVTFRNNNIELPDSASDPEGSMGYVLFGMRLKADIGPYTVVRNIAHIQFDRNDWIETNAAEVLITPEDYTRGTRIQVYPNPAHRLATAVMLDENSYPLTAQRMVITNLQGTVMKEQRVFAEKVQLDLSDLMPGFYLISLESTDGAQATARLIVGANPQPEW